MADAPLRPSSSFASISIGRELYPSAPGSSCVDAHLNPRAAPPFEEREDAWTAALALAVDDDLEGRIPAWARGGGSVKFPAMHWSQVHVWLDGASASLEGWINILASALNAIIDKMRWPTISGRISIAGVFLNALGVWLLFYFRLETVGGYVTMQLINETNARNRKRMPARRLGYGLLWFGVALQAVALFFPDASP